MTHVVRVAFRTEGGRRTGLGHVRRCLSLAQAFQILGAQSLFLLDGDPEVSELVSAVGFETTRIRSEHDLVDTICLCSDYGADVIVADSYALSTSYFRGLSESFGTVVVLDDLADRELPVKYVVNGSAKADQLRYQVGPQTSFLLGPQYILLRSEFSMMPTRTHSTHVRRVLITLGGSDTNNLTLRLMQWVARTLGSVKQDVVVGPLFENREALHHEAKMSAGSIVLHHNPQNMRNLMLTADLALCGGGQTTYELAAVGTPSIAIQTAENVTGNLKGLSSMGTLVWVGDAHDVDLESKLIAELLALSVDMSRRAAMSGQGRALVDGQGAARVARVLLGLTETPVL